MPSSFYFNGKRRVLPGVYSRILGGRQNPPLNLDYGAVLIIDNTALGSLTNNGIRGGAGVAGELSSGKDSVYEARSLAEFREFVGYGWWWKAAEFLFNPSGSFAGISKAYIIKPATTTASLMTFTATGGGTAGGTFKVKTRDEGAAANGTLSSTKLVSGYAYTIETGAIDTNKWIFKIWRGNYKGAYSDSIAYDEISQSAAAETPTLLVQSPEFDNVQNLIDWANTDQNFGSYFVLDPTSAVTGAGTVNAADIAAITGFQVAAGGTATYDKIGEALEVVKDLPYNFVITTTASDVHLDANIIKIKSHILTQAKYDKFLMCAGDNTTLADTITSARSLNSAKVMIQHSSIRKSSNATAARYRVWDSFFHACVTLGRLAGLAPQIPLTNKSLGIDGLTSQLTEQDQERALEAGVLVTIFNDATAEWVNLQGVNTLQNNLFQVNNDGTSYSIQIMRIAAQINRELIVNANLQLLNDPFGVNRNTLSATDVQGWVKGYLQRRVATDTQDNLILSYQNTTVSQEADAYFVTYEFVPNGEINKLFLTGFML